MTRSSCPTCRVRFTRVTAAHLAACPFCAQPLQTEPAAAVLGYRLLSIEPLLTQEPDALRTLDVVAAAELQKAGERRHRADA
jgi:hypothetical protein